MRPCPPANCTPGCCARCSTSSPRPESRPAGDAEAGPAPSRVRVACGPAVRRGSSFPCMNKGKPYFFTVILAVAGLALLGNRVDADSDRFYSDLTRLDKVVTRITESYVEEVSSKDLVDAAIDGMRDVLDPHTAYFEAKDYENLKVSTEGEFGGLGIQIGIRENVLTVVSPLSGTPAHRMGLRAGDQILRIDTLDTRGITVDGAVDKLRGKPGSKVTLRIGREGVPEPLDYTITREVIKIESVPHASML